MSYLFGMDVICYNAFYAVQNERSYLSEVEIGEFCRILEKEVVESFKSEEELSCCRVLFDLSEDGNALMPLNLVKTDDYIVHYGDDISQEDLNTVNLCLGFGAIVGAFERARSRFREVVCSSDSASGKSLVHTV
ncbi:MAG: hypothetical protein IJ113_00295 [Eggerthellaceae bacterium]|nr:hypothetical protein [Eggerthellaceae bacterium]